MNQEGCEHGCFQGSELYVNSVRTRIGAVQEWLRKERPDVPCLQETKAQDKGFPVKEFEDVGYQVAFKGRESYNGVAVLSRHPVK
ncbi:MAG: endonuclease/exonuclease/phosphatase family protein [Thermodesulfobacteriota bacterium]